MKFLSDKLSPQEIESFGKKAGNLALLHNSGSVVPDGFVLRWEDQVNIDEIEIAINKIGGYPVAVRSSGQLEDLEGTSFAGQYETFLYVDTAEGVVDSIRKCFESTKSERIKEYIKNKNIVKTDEELLNSFSVLIQKMVDPSFAGVSFSVNPINGREEEVLIECCSGIGEKLVSGEVTPNQYVYNIKEQKIVDENIEEDLEVNEDFFFSMSENILKIESFFKTPQDIEWAVDKDGKLWILQARPITTFNWRSDFGEMTNADLKDGGISSAVCTTMMYSLYRNAMNLSMPSYFKKLTLLRDDSPKNWLHHFYGRGFWDAGAVKKMLECIPGYDEKKFDLDLGIMKDYGTHGPKKTPTNIVTILRAIPVLLGMEGEFKKCYADSSQYYNDFDEIEKDWHERISKLEKLDDKELFSQFIDLYENVFIKTEPEYFRTIYNNSNLQTAFKEFLEKIENKTSQTIQHINLFSELDEVSHLQIQRDLKKVYESLEDRAHLYEEVDEFLRKHFHHGDRELDLTVERWGENPKRVVELAKNYVEQKKSSKSIFEIEKKRVLSLIEEQGFIFSTLNKNKFLNKLKFVRDYLILRERMRELSTRCYYLIRLYLLEIAKRFVSLGFIEKEFDIFHLDIDEVLNITKNNELSSIKEDIHYRERRYLGMKNIDAPNDFGFGRLETSTELISEDGKTIIRGIACSPGVYEGRLFVAKTLEETVDIKEGDILVTKFTDPGWTPTLGKVSAVVTEVGGVLSHAAVISREYGIPAILNVKNATSVLKTGDVATIDGNQGLIIKED